MQADVRDMKIVDLFLIFATIVYILYFVKIHLTVTRYLLVELGKYVNKRGFKLDNNETLMTKITVLKSK